MLILIALIVLFLIYPYLRIFFKRISLYFKLRTLCRERNLRLHGGYPLWIFSRKKDARYDFYLEGEDTVLAVKLFAVKSKTKTLYFINDASYRIRSYLGLFSRFAVHFVQPVDSAVRPLPQYTPDMKNEAWYAKTMRELLLLHPSCGDIRRCRDGQEQIIGTGDTVGNLTLCSFSTLDSIL